MGCGALLKQIEFELATSKPPLLKRKVSHDKSDNPRGRRREKRRGDVKWVYAMRRARQAVD
jgi:hypothetical protein